MVNLNLFDNITANTSPITQPELRACTLQFGRNGDIVLGHGIGYELMKDRYPEGFGVIHVGIDPQIHRWLGRQYKVLKTWFFDTEKIIGPDGYNDWCGKLCRDDGNADACRHVARRLEIPEHIEIVQAVLRFGDNSPGSSRHGIPFWPRQAVLSQEAWEWAAQQQPYLQGDAGLPYILFQPYSVGTDQCPSSCNIDSHWPHYKTALKLLLETQPCNVVLTGQGYQATTQHPRLINMLDQTPSIEHLYALAMLAGMVVTTCNSLGHFCALQNLVTLCCGNRPLRGSMFEVWLKQSNRLKLVQWDEPLEIFERFLKDM